MAQQQVHKQKPSASVSRAREYAQAQEDQAHTERLREARTACRRARSLSEAAQQFLESTN